MANGNLLPNWSFRRKLPEPFEDYSDDPVCMDPYPSPALYNFYGLKDYGSGGRRHKV